MYERKVKLSLVSFVLMLTIFFVLNTHSRTRRHAFTLFKARCSGMRATFFCERVIHPWNQRWKPVGSTGAGCRSGRR